MFGAGADTAIKLSAKSLVGIGTVVQTRPVGCNSLSCIGQLVEKEKKNLRNHGNNTNITPNTEGCTYSDSL